MPYELKVNPNPLHVGEGFNVGMTITSPDNHPNDRYRLYVVTPGTEVLLDDESAEVRFVIADTPSVLIFHSIHGFSTPGQFTLGVYNLAEPGKDVARIDLDVMDAVASSGVVADTPERTSPRSDAGAMTIETTLNPAETDKAESKPKEFGRRMWHAIGWGTLIGIFVFCALVVSFLATMPWFAIKIIASNSKTSALEAPAPAISPEQDPKSTPTPIPPSSLPSLPSSSSSTSTAPEKQPAPQKTDRTTPAGGWWINKSIGLP